MAADIAQGEQIVQQSADRLRRGLLFAPLIFVAHFLEEGPWRRAGQELFYRNVDTSIAAQVRTGPGFAVWKRVPLFTGD